MIKASYMNAGAKKRSGPGRAAFFFLLPSLAGLAIFFLIPFGDAVRRSFLNPLATRFAGFDNYISVINNDAFQTAAANTFKFVGICIPALLAISLVIALLVRASRPRDRVFKTTYLLPMAIPVGCIVVLWQALFNDHGLINSFLLAMGLNSVSFMETDAAFWVLIATYLWKNSGYNMILWLAGLDGISQSLYEAAKVDGAGTWQIFRRITLPQLAPTLYMASVLSLVNSFKVFREAYLVAGSYPNKSIYLLQHLLNNWFSNLDISRICAAAVLIAAFLLAVILFLQKLWGDE